ncbi:hypothetical protein [Salsuginibacillus kocurii]|uniref:hypothetical protein n=1 Tax=Salsuginibacillus kocurii TaxID=427078 RepID=UPI0003635E98|nr:hypothetical protein [Salsuginibacillus kocurii]
MSWFIFFAVVISIISTVVTVLVIKLTQAQATKSDSQLNEKKMLIALMAVLPVGFIFVVMVAIMLMI